MSQQQDKAVCPVDSSPAQHLGFIPLCMGELGGFDLAPDPLSVACGQTGVCPESRSTVRKDSQVTYRKRGLKKLKKFYLEKMNLKGDIIVIFTHIKGIRHFSLIPEDER